VENLGQAEIDMLLAWSRASTDEVHGKAVEALRTSFGLASNTKTSTAAFDAKLQVASCTSVQAGDG
jgi:hypothetical protein